MIYAVRHGQTDWNKEGRLQGRKGLELNEEGVRQAEALREQLGAVAFDCVYSSPQARALQTAAIATGANVVVDDRLDVPADGNILKLSSGNGDFRIYNFKGRIGS